MANDADIAFNLQVEEALTASLLDGGAASSAADDVVFGAELSQILQNDNLSKYELELLDQYGTEAAAKRMRLDLGRQVHDRAFASQVTKIPEVEWNKTGDNFNIPYGEGSSSKIDYVVHVKGLVEPMAAGIGVAICDCNGVLVFEVSKGLSRYEHQGNRELVEVKSLIERLDAAILLGLKRIELVYDNTLLHQYITGKMFRSRQMLLL